MSEIAVTIIKVLYLALLWLFILSVVSVIRSDLFGRTVPARDSAEPQPLEDPAPPPKRSRKHRGRPHRLVIAQGPQTGLSADLGPGVIILIGRGSDCQLLLDDDYVSTRHARVVDSEQGLYVEDLGSTNGTYVNGQRITAPTFFSMQDTLRIGKTILRLES